MWLATSTVLDLPLEEALPLVTDGGHDLAIDALHVGDIIDGEFVVTIVQGKYKRKPVGKFPASDVGKVAQIAGVLFDPDLPPPHARFEVKARVEEIRSLVREGNMPTVRVVLCNNGERWGEDADSIIANARLPNEQVVWQYVGPDELVGLMQRPREVHDDLQLVGEAIVEEFDFCRVLVGKVSVTELARLVATHGDRLLERNIRRYLGLRNNRVNLGIASTLRSPAKRSNFYFFNNGVTLTCAKFRHNALQGGNYRAKLERLQVINGGQTCHTIWRTLEQLPGEDFSQTYILVRVYELDDDQRELVHEITYATNSQNPVDLRDLRANDELQKRLELGLKDLGYVYTRKRGGSQDEGPVITPAQAAEAVTAVWRQEPHLARSGPGQFFGRLYRRVFTESLSPVEVVLAVEVLRRVQEEEQKLLTMTEPSKVVSEVGRFLPYSTHAVAMFVAKELFGGMSAERLQRDHRTLLDTFQASAVEYYWRGVLKVRLLLAAEGLDDQRASLQRLAGAFRRGDLFERVDLVLEMVSWVHKLVQPGLDEMGQMIALFDARQEDPIPEPLLSLVEEGDAFVALVEQFRNAAQGHALSPKSAKTRSISLMERRFRDALVRLAALRASTNKPQ